MRSTLVALAVAGCSGAGPDRTLTAKTALPVESEPGIGSIDLGRRGVLKMRGAVVEMQLSGELGIAVVLDGPQPQAERTLLLAATDAAAVPFETGDVIDVVVDCTRGGWHQVCDGIVRDDKGGLLIAAMGTGDTSQLPGWTATPGPVIEEPRDGEAGHVRRALTVTHEGKTIVTRAPWQRLETRDGTWLVAGTDHRWRGKRVSEAVDYTTFYVTRKR